MFAGEDSMRFDRKYLVAVASLAVLAVVFGLAGTVAPGLDLVSPQQSFSSSSDPVTHFMNPPTFDSDWVSITDKRGQSFTLTHDLNTTDALVDVVGRQSLAGGNHKLFFGATLSVQGFNQTYGGTETDGAMSVVQTSDGGYAMAGVTDSSGAGMTDSWLIKIDSAGNMEWNQTYGGTDYDDACSVVQTFDGGYALAGCTNSSGAGGDDFWLVKTDSAGNMEWNQTYGGPKREWAWSVVQTVDGGYAMAGQTNSSGAGMTDSWLIKTDSAGNMEWNKTYGGPGTDYGYSLVQTFDGGYALAGFTNSSGAGDHDFWLIKTDGKLGFSTGLSMIDFTDSNITFYRGSDDPYWNYLRVRIWIFVEPTWMFGDINQDGVVDAEDLYIVSRNYGKTFSLLSLTGIIAVTGVHAYKKRKKQPA